METDMIQTQFWDINNVRWMISVIYIERINSIAHQSMKISKWIIFLIFLTWNIVTCLNNAKMIIVLCTAGVMYCDKIMLYAKVVMMSWVVVLINKQWVFNRSYYIYYCYLHTMYCIHNASTLKFGKINKFLILLNM